VSLVICHLSFVICEDFRSAYFPFATDE
jgi:hypothetical protein